MASRRACGREPSPASVLPLYFISRLGSATTCGLTEIRDARPVMLSSPLVRPV